MLKSTYKPHVADLPPLPEGWSQHKAPTGHSYYYNPFTKQSTYTRPAPTHSFALAPFEAPDKSPDVPPNGHATQLQYLHHGYAPAFVSGSHDLPLHGSYHRVDDSGRGGYGAQQRPQPKDRPKSKHEIPGCEPWLLVTTRLGRRFVFNPVQNESFFKFPPLVMKGVVEYDRREREKRAEKERGGYSDKVTEKIFTQADLAETKNVKSTASAAPTELSYNITQQIIDRDDDEYEEVEVTEDEEEEHRSKRQKTEDGDAQEPVEFNEDDIAYQLSAMGHDYGLDPGEYGNGDGEELEEGAEGLTLTKEDANALFKDLLNDYQISPYEPWENIVEAGLIIEDDRYTALPNMRSRKDAWSKWSRGRVQQLKEQREKDEKKDPRISYFAFLQSYATPKLYWPEFRRKYNKKPEMRDIKLLDKDKEKWYREYINRLKLPESTLKRDMVELLRSLPLRILNRSTLMQNLPPLLLIDIRYISLRPLVRDPLIETYISALPPLPTDFNISPEEEAAQLKEKREREQREKALEERQKNVREEKRKQEETLLISKELLRGEEQEVERAKKFRKDGLRGYMEDEE